MTAPECLPDVLALEILPRLTCAAGSTWEWGWVGGGVQCTIHAMWCNTGRFQGDLNIPNGIFILEVAGLEAKETCVTKQLCGGI